MTCEEVERDELVEHYVLGRLDKKRQEAFEDHYFNCSRCLERLRLVEETRGVLGSETVDDRRRWWRRAAVGLAAAATLVLAIRVGQDLWRRPEAPRASPPKSDVSLPATAGRDSTTTRQLPAELGEIQLPAYTSPRLRATTSEAQRVFNQAMLAYQTGDCDAAIPELRRALTIDESLMPARFYLGACELRVGRVSEAVPTLQRVIASGESPYLEDARFFLAKARIRQGDLTAARQELTRVMSLQGDRLDDAKRLFDRLR